MTLRTPWQDRYGLAIQTAQILGNHSGSAGTPTDFSDQTGNYLGITIDDQFGIPLTEHPDIDSGTIFTNPDKTTGQSLTMVGLGHERTKIDDTPVVTLTFAETDIYMINTFLWLLFQTGATETTGISKQLYTFIPYTVGSCEVWAEFIRQLSATGSDWQRMSGCIVTSLTFSGEEGQPMALTVDLAGVAYDEDVTGTSGAAANLVLPKKAPLLFQDSTFKLGSSLTATNIPNFSITIANNAITKQRNSDSSGRMMRHILQKMTITGSFGLPWDAATVGGNAQVAAFIAGTPQKFRLYFGTEQTDETGPVGSLDISGLAHYNAAPLSSEDEIQSDLAFDAVDDGTTAFTILSVDDYNDDNLPTYGRGIPA